MLVRVVHSNSVVEWKVTLGVEVQRSELSLAVASADPRREGHMGQWEFAYGVRARQRNAQRGCREMQGVRKREPALVLELESLQDK